MNTYTLTWADTDEPVDYEEYENLDDAYDTADNYSAATNTAVRVYENDAILSVIRNF